MNPKSDCRNCGKRKLGCHTQCAKYQEWKIQKEKENSWLKHNRIALSELESSMKQSNYYPVRLV